MSAATAWAAVDVGAATITIARDGAPPDAGPAPDGGWRTVLAGLGEGLRDEALCLAVPDAWLDGSAAGATAQEEVRYLAEHENDLGPLRWTGQLSAVAALTARDRGPGRYLICDVGASGVRVASVQVDVPATGGAIVTTIAVRHEDGGWSAFDASLRTRLAADGRRLPADWYRHATTDQEDRRARVALRHAAENADYADIRVYSLAGADGAGIVAAELIGCFATIAHALTVGIAAVTAGRRPDVAVITGGFGWFPLVSSTVADEIGTDASGPLIKPATAAAQGALLFASGQVRQADPPPLTIAMPVNRISGGLLETTELPLDWTSSFAELADGPLHLEGEDLMLIINGSPAVVPLPGITPGPHLIGIRRGWSGANALVVRPVAGGDPRIAALAPEATR